MGVSNTWQTERIDYKKKKKNIRKEVEEKRKDKAIVLPKCNFLRQFLYNENPPTNKHLLWHFGSVHPGHKMAIVCSQCVYTKQNCSDCDRMVTSITGFFLFNDYATRTSKHRIIQVVTINLHVPRSFYNHKPSENICLLNKYIFC